MILIWANQPVRYELVRVLFNNFNGEISANQQKKRWQVPKIYHVITFTDSTVIIYVMYSYTMIRSYWRQPRINKPWLMNLGCLLNGDHWLLKSGTSTIKQPSGLFSRVDITRYLIILK
jgi:hypothetical protein